MIKNLWFDTETTGLDPKKHGIWELSYILEIETKFTSHQIIMRPERPWQREAKAMLSKEQKQMIADGLTPAAGLKKFKKSLARHINKYDKKDKLTMYGWNVAYDANMLRGLFTDCGDDYFGSWFYNHPVDVMTVASDVIGYDKHEVKPFSLGNVAKYLGVDVDTEQLHGALYDVDVTMRVYNELMKRMKRQ